MSAAAPPTLRERDPARGVTRGRRIVPRAPEMNWDDWQRMRVEFLAIVDVEHGAPIETLPPDAFVS